MMATTTFHKYQGAGNDFILFDDRDGSLLAFDQPTIARLCDRHFGIGADGLMLLRDHPDYDFEMVYFNSDGRPSSMCGNGGRCIVRFARDRGLRRSAYRFLAVDGPHRARFTEGEREISLEMGDVAQVQRFDQHSCVVDTGSPHFVRFVESLAGIDVARQGREIRRSEPFAEAGINVNFVHDHHGSLDILTYERGVEAETLACGTGVTAAAIASVQRTKRLGEFTVAVRAKGGDLRVDGRRTGPESFTDLWLTGPAEFVFSGEIRP